MPSNPRAGAEIVEPAQVVSFAARAEEIKVMIEKENEDHTKRMKEAYENHAERMKALDEQLTEIMAERDELRDENE